jgi:hypothetical protein
LLRKWPRLRTWLDDAREFLAGKQQLERDLHDWEHAAEQDKTGALLTGLKLHRAHGWFLERPHQLSAEERALIKASIDYAEAEEKLRQAEQERKLHDAVALAEANKKTARRTKIGALVAVILAISSVIGGGFAMQQRSVAENAAKDLVRAAKVRAIELTRFAWVDLGAKQEEVDRLTEIARNLGQKPEVLVPDILKVQADGFDCETWLETGFRQLYCSVRNVVSFKKVESIVGLSIFLSGGPHDKELNLNDHKEFGHYNPKFLAWLDDYIVPQGMNDPRFNHVTRLVYKTQIGPVARALYHSHEILFADPEDYRAFEQRYQIVKKEYRERLRSGETNESRFGGDPGTFTTIKADYQRSIEEQSIVPGQKNLLQEQFRWLSDFLTTDRGDDGYLANTAGGFWVRRSIDGTDEQIFRLLTKLLETFEPDVLDK